MCDIVKRLRREATIMGMVGADPLSRDMLREAAAEIERLREERRWISVEERLPENDVEVLVLGKGWGSPAIGWREHQPHYIVPETIWTLGDELDRGYPPQNVTHWMPLPAPPEEGK